MQNQATGVLVLAAEYGRGTNVRFSKDARVIVLANGKTWNEPMVEQMIGRASRTMGQCNGDVFVHAHAADGGSTGIGMLKSRNEELPDDSHEILAFLFKWFDRLKQAEKLSMKAELKDKGWRGKLISEIADRNQWVATKLQK